MGRSREDGVMEGTGRETTNTRGLLRTHEH